MLVLTIWRSVVPAGNSISVWVAVGVCGLVDQVPIQLSFFFDPANASGANGRLLNAKATAAVASSPRRLWSNACKLTAVVQHCLREPRM